MEKNIPDPNKHMFLRSERSHHQLPITVRQSGILIKTEINDLRNESLIY